MAYGLPIISTLKFGLSEQIFPSINGLVYEPGNVDDLSAHIAALFDDADLRRELGANAKRVFDSINQYEHMLKSYAWAFEQALLSQNPPSEATND